MSTQEHVALIVEDDQAIADILRSIVASLGHSAIVVTHREDALKEIAKRNFCYAFLDMQLPESPHALASVITGLTLLKHDFRRAFPGRTATDKHRTQIIVVTAHSRDADFVTRVMQEGADDFLIKPFDEDLTKIADKVGRCLRHSERTDHALCADATKAATRASVAPPPSTRAPSKLTIHVSARVARSRYGLRIGERATTCTQGSLLKLLAFGAASAGGADGWIHVSELGRESAVHKALSRLQIEFRQSLRDQGVGDLLINDLGRYRLDEHIVLTVDEALIRHESAVVRALSQAVRSGVAPASPKKLSVLTAKTKPRPRARSA